MTETKDTKPLFTKIVGVGKDLKLDVTCGSCIFHKRFGFYTGSNDTQKRGQIPCNELSIEETSRPCVNYSIDPTLMRFKQKDHAVELLEELMSLLPKKNLNLFAAFINQEGRTRKQGYIFGQVVYVHLFGEDYLSNYAKAKIIRATGEYVYLQGMKNFKFDATVFHNSVLTKEQFEKKKIDLQKKKRLLDPSYGKHTSPLIPKIETKRPEDKEKLDKFLKDLKKGDYDPKIVDHIPAKAKAVRAKKVLKDAEDHFDNKREILSKDKSVIFKVRSTK